MRSQLYKKAKEEIKNLSNIGFNEEQWKWYYEQGVSKKLQQMDYRERLLLEAFVRVRRAKGLIHTIQ